MEAPEIPGELTGQIHEFLARGKVLVAVGLLRDATGCSIADAKLAIGMRFRECFPDQFSTYRNLSDENDEPS